MNLIKIFPIIILASVTLISCGGGGGSNEGLVYSGSKDSATVDSTNAKKLAIAATGGASQSIAADAAQESNPFLRSSGSASNSTIISTIAEHIKLSLTSGNRTVNAPLGICSSGSADQNTTSNSSTEIAGNIVFSRCELIGVTGVELNGRVDFSATIKTSNDGFVSISSLTMQFVKFRVTINGESETINMSLTCSGEPLVCNLSSDYVGLDGRIYRVEDLTVSFNDSTLIYTIDATVFDPDHGFIAINASLAYGSCVGGVPVSGSIVITGGGGSSSTVVFNNCDSFTVTFMLADTEYFWADIL